MVDGGRREQLVGQAAVVAHDDVIGFLHTSPAHLPTFQRLLQAADPAMAAVHAVDELLLVDAQTTGPTPDVRRRVHDHLVELAGRGAAVIVCTCSTIAGLAEQLSPVAGVDVIRVDRPMAEEAVRLGRRIAVVAAVPSTLAPSCDLLRECAAAAGRTVELTEVRCEIAWPHFLAGDLATYLREVRSSVEDAVARGGVDVVVLALASMAAVGDGRIAVPVLSSPAAAVARAVSVVR